MSQPPQSPRNTASPLTARLYDLEYPRSLGVYSTYQEVQSVVDTLADEQFPVQSTLIVGTDLKLMERVTGRKTWPRVISQGVLSGLWMGLFLGLLLLLITPGNVTIVLTSILMGIVFFTVWSVIGYAMTGGRRDFTSMTSTIPMQYELLVEHKHAAQARRILADSGAAPAPVPGPTAGAMPQPGQPAGGPQGGGQQYGGQQNGAPQGGAQQFGGQQYGAPQGGGQQYGAPQGGGQQHGGGQLYGGQQYGAPAPQSPAPGRPSYGQPAPSAPTSPATSPGQRGQRPSFGQPAGAPQSEPGAPRPESGAPRPEDDAPRTEGVPPTAPSQDRPQDGSSPR